MPLLESPPSPSPPPSATSPSLPPHRAANWVSAWGVLGCVAFLAMGLYRVVPHAIAPIWPINTLEVIELVLYVVCIVFTAWAEGYRGFQKGFVPRVLSRAQWLADHPGRVNPLLAPLFVMGFFGINRRKFIFTWVFTVALIAVIVAMSWLQQPWRGMLDAGVVVGLSWGVACMLIGLVRMGLGTIPEGDPALPPSWQWPHEG